MPTSSFHASAADLAVDQQMPKWNSSAAVLSLARDQSGGMSLSFVSSSLGPTFWFGAGVVSTLIVVGLVSAASGA